MTYPGQETPFVSGGAILPVSDYVQYMPNFKERIEKWDLQPYIDKLRQADGKYYLLPGLYESPQPQYSIAVRQDMWEKAGITEDPQTWDDLRDELETIKEANPDVYPMSDRWSTTNNGPLEATLNLAAPNFGTVAGWGFGNGLVFDEDSETFTYAASGDGYKELVDVLRLARRGRPARPRVGHAGRRHREAEVRQRPVPVHLGQHPGDRQLLARRSTDAGNTEAKVHLIRVPEGPAGDNVASGSRVASGFMLSSEAAEKPYFLALLQFVDWLYYSDERSRVRQVRRRGHHVHQGRRHPRTGGRRRLERREPHRHRRSSTPTSGSATASGCWPTARRTT